MSIISNNSNGVSLKNIYAEMFPKKQNLKNDLKKWDSRILPVGSTIEDTLRLAKFASSGKGLLFASKQAGLQVLNKRPETRIFNPIGMYASAVPYVRFSRVWGASLTDGQLYKKWIDLNERSLGLSAGLAAASLPYGNLFLGQDPIALVSRFVDGKKWWKNDGESSLVNLNSFNNNTNAFPDGKTYSTLAYGDLIKAADYNSELRYSKKISNIEEERINQATESTSPIDNRLESFYKIKTGAPDYINKLMNSEEIHRDFIPIKIYDIGRSKWIILRAFISGITESPTVEWNTKSYIGRPEKVYTYVGAERTLTFTIKVMAFSSSEMKPLWKKLNHIMGLNYPTYTSSGHMRGPFVKLTIGSLYDQTPGFFNSIAIQYDDGTPWEIGQIDDVEVRLPMGFEITCGFTVVGDYALENGGKQIFGLPQEWDD